MDDCATWLDLAPVSVFTAIDAQARREAGSSVINLHQGKTYFPPCANATDWLDGDFPLLAAEHAPPGGIRLLRETASDFLKNRQRLVVDPDDIVVTAGATHGVFTVLSTLLEPGDEVLLLSPQWLFAAGLVAAVRGRPVEVPIFLELAADRRFDVASAVDAAVTPRTRAVYFNTPNNPTGVNLSPRVLHDLVALADHHNLWLVADNAYENYDFSSDGFVDVATLDGGRERSYSVYTLSKTFAMPGYRVGYVAAPPGRAPSLVTAGLYSAYSVATTSQQAATAALRTSPTELDERHRVVATTWQLVDELLDVPHTPVSGGLYTLLDLAEFPGGVLAFLDRCLQAGVSLSPGNAFGAAASRYARLCFTAAPPALLRRALEIVNDVYRRPR